MGRTARPPVRRRTGGLASGPRPVSHLHQHSGRRDRRATSGTGPAGPVVGPIGNSYWRTSTS
jgi:hypothetical protein